MSRDLIQGHTAIKQKFNHGSWAPLPSDMFSVIHAVPLREAQGVSA